MSTIRIFQLQVFVLTGGGFPTRLKRGCGRAEDHHRAARLSPLDGRFAGVVARNAVLLVRGVMLFVDDQDAQVFERGEHRRSRPDDNGNFLFPDFFPFQVALDVGESTVQNGDF